MDGGRKGVRMREGGRRKGEGRREGEEWRIDGGREKGG